MELQVVLCSIAILLQQQGTVEIVRMVGMELIHYSN
jgi:hypothetical protein